MALLVEACIACTYTCTEVMSRNYILTHKLIAPLHPVKHTLVRSLLPPLPYYFTVHPQHLHPLSVSSDRPHVLAVDWLLSNSS